MGKWRLFVAFMMLSQFAQAQPLDARIIKDLTSPGVLSVTLFKGGGKVWSKTDLQYYWERSASVKRKAGLADFPGATLEVGGIARYTIVGSSYRFKKFLVGSNSYSGIPNPSQKEIITLLNGNLREALGDNYFNRVVGPLEKLELAADPRWQWHTPNSVSFRVRALYSEIASNTEVEKVDRIYEVRLYRDDPKSFWKSFGSSERETRKLEVKKYSEDEVKAMPTMGFLAAEKAAQVEFSRLPVINVPAFKSDIELFRFTHKMLLEGKASEYEAFLRQSFGPKLLVQNSAVQLSPEGAGILEKTLASAFKGKARYRDQYCPDPKVDSYAPGALSITNKTADRTTRMRAELTGGTYQNGVKTGGEWKLVDLDVFLFDKPDDLARLASYAPDTLCQPDPKAQMLSGLDAAVQAAQNNQIAQENLVKTSQAMHWTLVENQNARLKINFPGVAQLTEGKMNGKYPMFTYQVSNDTGLYRVVSVVYPTKLNRAQAMSVVEGAARDFAANNEAHIADTSELMSGTFGRFFNLEREGGSIKMRVFVFGDTLYQLIYSTGTANFLPQNQKAFFDSFQPVRAP